MRRRVWAWALTVLAAVFAPVWTAGADEVSQVIDGLDVSAWQAAADEAGAEVDVLQLLRALAGGEAVLAPEGLPELLKGIVLGEAGGAYEMLLAFMGPALLWAVSRRLTSGGRLSGAAGFACCLVGVGLMLDAFASQMELARTTVRQLGNLTEQVFPVLTSLMSAAGRPGAAGAVQTMVAFGGGALTAFLEHSAAVICAAAAVLAAAGSLTERISLDGLFRLCCTAGGWIFGGVMSAFLAMTTMTGVMGTARDGVTIRAARYAADNFLPVVGGDVADAMDAMAQSAGLVRSAAGVTGVIVMLAVCIRPVIRLALGMLMYRLAAALTEPVADGPLKKCAEQLAQAAQLLLAAVAAGGAMFITLAGVCLSAG